MGTDKKADSDEKLIKKFVDADSTAQLKRTADKIMEADTDIDDDKLEKAGKKFQKEKKEDALKEAKNDADFSQPKLRKK